MSDDLDRIIASAGVDPLALGPFAALVAAFDAVVRSRLTECLDDVTPVAYSDRVPATSDGAFRWDRWYSAKQLAERWEIDKQRVYEIPDYELPYRNIAGTRRKRYHGLDVLRYEGVLTQEEYDAIQATRRPGKQAEALLHPPAQPAGLRQVRGGLHPRHE